MLSRAELDPATTVLHMLLSIRCIFLLLSKCYAVYVYAVYASFSTMYHRVRDFARILIED